MFVWVYVRYMSHIQVYTHTISLFFLMEFVFYLMVKSREDYVNVYQQAELSLCCKIYSYFLEFWKSYCIWSLKMKAPYLNLYLLGAYVFLYWIVEVILPFQLYSWCLNHTLDTILCLFKYLNTLTEDFVIKV